MVSIPFELLGKLGFKQDSVLVAKWKLSDDQIELFVKEIVVCYFIDYFIPEDKYWCYMRKVT